MQGALVDGKGEMWHSLAHHTIMFSLLADKLDNTFRRLRGLGKISEKNIADALRDIRLALLEADVEFGVAREFIGRVKERAMGQEVLKSIKPGEQIVKIFRDEIAALLGGDAVGLDLTDPARIMVVGLNGAGKTTTSAKLALRLKNEGRRPLLVACDLVRPAAVDQLATLAEQIGVPVYKPAPGSRDSSHSSHDVCSTRICHPMPARNKTPVRTRLICRFLTSIPARIPRYSNIIALFTSS